MKCVHLSGVFSCRNQLVLRQALNVAKKKNETKQKNLKKEDYKGDKDERCAIADNHNPRSSHLRKVKLSSKRV